MKKDWGTREKILMGFGIVLMSASFVVTEVLGGPFHEMFLLAGLACCGISIASWGDKK